MVVGTEEAEPADDRFRSGDAGDFIFAAQPVLEREHNAVLFNDAGEHILEERHAREVDVYCKSANNKPPLVICRICGEKSTVALMWSSRLG